MYDLEIPLFRYSAKENEYTRPYKDVFIAALFISA